MIELAPTLPPEVVPDLPQVFGRYLLIKRLSRGGMGEIFLGKLGEIEGFEKPVIIKKILPNLSVDEEFTRRFIDEAQVAIKLNHANIAQVYEVGRVDGDYFLAMEYVEGRDLRRILTRCRELGTRLPPDLCLYVGRDLAAGLGYAHRRTDAQGRTLALVHCDISPPNVVTSFEGEVKIIDFGIAKSAIRLAGSNPNMGFGKFGYMAPEQLVRGGLVDRRTDIYAAGVLLYELLTGERLHIFPEGADYRQIARIVTRGEYIPASERDPRLDPSLDPILARALAPKGDDRYQTAEEFRDAIQQRLYQMNPTISADSLAHFVRGLFSDEIDSERQLVASAREVDLAEFQDQFTGMATHTVTFARAGLLGGRGAGPSGLHAAVEAAGTSQVLRRHGATALAAVVAMLAGGVLVYWVARPRPPLPVAAERLAAPTTAPLDLALAAAAPGAPKVTQIEPVVTPLPPKPLVKIDPRPEAMAKGKRPPRLGHPSAAEAPRAALTKEAIEAKFRAVKRDYDGFKGEYGGRLDAEWNAVTHEMVFGAGDDRYERVDNLLESLRRAMSRVRGGG